MNGCEAGSPWSLTRRSNSASPVVARAYVDQLTRTNAIDAARATTLRTAIDRGASAKAQLTTLAGELETAAASAGKIDAARMKSLAATLTGIAGQ